MNHYSQNDEQEVILDFFKDRTGNLLEIGAFDGVTFSNTRALLELGWSGVLVEPDPRNFHKLLLASMPFIGCVTLIPCAVSGVPGGFSRLLMDTTHDRGWASTISGRCESGILSQSEVRVMVPVFGIGAFGCGFDFINIDAEGEDFGILKTLPDQTLFDCKMFCVEPHDPKERFDMKAWFSIKGFRTFYETPENVLFIRA